MKVFKIVGSVFFAIGLLFLILGGYFFQGTRAFLSKSVAVQGEIIQIFRGSSSSNGSTSSSRTYYPMVEFVTFEGDTIQFQGSIGSNPPSYQAGDRVTVHYLPENPYQAKIDSFFQLWFFSVLFGGMGFFFAFPGLILLMIVKRKKRLNQWLMENGQIVSTDFQEVVFDRSVRVNGRSPYRIITQWQNPMDNKIYTFKSKHLWFNPEKYIPQTRIQVRIDPNNSKRHLMDTSYLPESG